jgi:hypothetical protein
MRLGITIKELVKIHRQKDGARVDLEQSFLMPEERRLFAPQNAQKGHRGAPWEKYDGLYLCRFPAPSEAVSWSSEEAFAREVARYRREAMSRLPELYLLHHLPNENSHHKAGVVAGLPDWHLPVARSIGGMWYYGLWIELKVGEGDLRDTQRVMIERLMAPAVQNRVVIVWDSLQAVQEEIEGYLYGT